MSLAWSCACFQLSPLSHGCPGVCTKASADINRRNKAFCLAAIRAAQPQTFFLVKLLQSSCFSPSRDRLLLKICEEKGAFHCWQEGQGEVVHQGFTNLFEFVCPTSVLHQHLLNPGVFLNINDSSRIIRVLKDPFCWLYFLFPLLRINTIP